MRNMLILLLLILSGPFPVIAAADTTATLTLFTGDCYVWHNRASDEADIDQALYAGDSVRTGKDSRAELSFSDGSTIRLGENSKFLIRQNGTTRSFTLLSGKFWAKVAKLSERARFEVESPTAVAGVRGTVFKVEVDQDSTSRVAVEEGEVEVHNPSLRGRMVRLAALQEAFVRRRLDPSAPRRFDPAKEPRWERLTRKVFFNLVKITKGLLTGAARIARDEESLLREVQRLKAAADAGSRPDAKLARGLDEAQRRAFENRRKFRLLLLRAEKRFRQAKIASSRVDEPGDPAPLTAETEALKSEIDRLASQFENCDSRIMELLDRMDGALGGPPQGGPAAAGQALAKVQAFDSKAGLARVAVQNAAARLETAEAAMAGFLQEISRIRALAATQPLLAREQLLEFRRRYAVFKQANGSFIYPNLDRLWLEARTARSEARRLAAGVARDDAVSAAITGPISRIVAAAQSIAVVWQRSQRLQRQGQTVERMILEIDTALKSNR